MKSYTGVAAHALPEPTAPDFTARLRDMIATLDVWARDASFGFGRIERGEAPSGSGGTIGVTDHGFLTGLLDDDHSQYLLLDGRAGGQVLVAADTTSAPLTIRSGTTNLDNLIFTNSSGSIFGAIRMRSGATERMSIYTDLTTTGLSLLVSDFSTSGVVGLDIYPLASKLIQVIGAKLDWATNTPALLGVDAANASAVVANSDDNIRIVRRASAQTGRAIAYYEQTRATELFIVRADGHHYSTQGASNLTGQTGNIAAQTLLTGAASDTAGMYRVSVYIKTTTAGNALDAVAVTIAYNDGTAQTVVPIAAHDLATLNAHSQASVVLNLAASQNISYTTTVAITGAPQYEIHVRTEALG